MEMLNRQVLLKPILKESSVIITSEKPELTNRAIVVKSHDLSAVKTGDEVIYNNRAGMPVEIDGEDYILTDDSNLFIKW